MWVAKTQFIKESSSKLCTFISTSSKHQIFVNEHESVLWSKCHNCAVFGFSKWITLRFIFLIQCCWQFTALWWMQWRRETMLDEILKGIDTNEVGKKDLSSFKTQWPLVRIVQHLAMEWEKGYLCFRPTSTQCFCLFGSEYNLRSSSCCWEGLHFISPPGSSPEAYSRRAKGV